MGLVLGMLVLRKDVNVGGDNMRDAASDMYKVEDSSSLHCLATTNVCKRVCINPKSDFIDFSVRGYCTI